MTQTLTTERLREIAERRSPSLRWGEAEQISAELLANREAQPVGFDVLADAVKEVTGGIRMEFNPETYKGHQPVPFMNFTSLSRIVEMFRTAPPAYPEKLPCPVRLMPGIIFGKGVPTTTMLEGLRRREEYNAEMDAMTPEQKAEHDAAREEFQAMLFSRSTPAPAVSSELLEAMDEVIRISDRDHDAWSRAKNAISACRAAMLAAPTEGEKQ